MMDDKVLEKMLNNLIEEAGPIAVNNMESKDEEIPEVQFSKEHEEKMKKIFADARKELEKKSSKESSKVVELKNSETRNRKGSFGVRKLLFVAVLLVLAFGLMTSASRMERKFY